MNIIQKLGKTIFNYKEKGCEMKDIVITNKSFLWIEELIQKLSKTLSENKIANIGIQIPNLTIRSLCYKDQEAYKIELENIHGIIITIEKNKVWYRGLETSSPKCKWKLLRSDSGEYLFFKTECEKETALFWLPNDRELDYIYCPYCGKEISDE